MPVVIRDGGRTWGPDNDLHDTVALIPDRSYATIYQAVVEDCQQHGALDPSKNWQCCQRGSDGPGG